MNHYTQFPTAGLWRPSAPLAYLAAVSKVVRRKGKPFTIHAATGRAINAGGQRWSVGKPKRRWPFRSRVARSSMSAAASLRATVGFPAVFLARLRAFGVASVGGCYDSAAMMLWPHQ